MSVEQEAKAVGAYWEAYPKKDDPSTWGLVQTVTNVISTNRDASQSVIRNFNDAEKYYRAAAGQPPEPPVVPGPPSPGAGMAVARLGDVLNHGGKVGPVVTGIAARVFIGNMPVACAGDQHLCPMFSGAKPHVGGTIAKGSSSVFVGNKPVARVADATVCTSEPGNIAAGEMSVLIGG